MTTIPPDPEEALVTISTPKSDTVRVRDRVESSRFEFYFDGEVEISPTPTDDLFFPVDVAARIQQVEEILIPVYSGFVVHDHSTGEIVEKNISEIADTTLRGGTFEVEIVSAPMKVYLLIDTDVNISRGPNSIEISFSTPSSFRLGVRTHHEQPAGTITTPADAESLMEAVSHFGSALKTTSVERSWPTLRGYPPELEIGDTLSVPETIRRPEQGVTIEVPKTLESIYKVTPLAYYLAAEVRPIADSRDDPTILAAGTEIPLCGNLSDSATKMLQDNILLDSIVRFEGLYPFDTYERGQILDLLPWNSTDVYDLSLAERIVKYDEVPDEVRERIRPIWPLTADLSSGVKTIEVLPHIAEELAKVRVPQSATTDVEPAPSYVDDFIRADGSGIQSVERTTTDPTITPNITSPEPWDTQMHVSLRDDYPIGSNTTTAQAYERHINHKTPAQGAIEVHVVCNDDEMREEEIVTELYGVRDLLEFDVNFHHNLEKSELSELLERHFDLLHYIGHIDEQGILCQDGYLNVHSDVEHVGIEAFILNACTSVDQGEALLDHGAIGGIATLFDVPNSSATRLGRTLSRLLNRGFPIRAELNIARDSSVLGRRWVSMGNGRVSLTQTEGAFPYVININPRENGTFDVELEYFETTSYRIGSVTIPATSWGTQHVLPNRLQQNITEPELDELFSLEVSPVRCDGEIYWTDEISPTELRENLD